MRIAVKFGEDAGWTDQLEAETCMEIDSSNRNMSCVGAPPSAQIALAQVGKIIPVTDFCGTGGGVFQ